MKICFCEYCTNTIKCCGECEYTDGSIYSSYPPKVLCMITGEFHNFDYACDLDNFNHEKDGSLC